MLNRDLLSEDRKFMAECSLHMQEEYQIALHHSLEMHLTAKQCSIFDDKSHEIECLRHAIRQRLHQNNKK